MSSTTTSMVVVMSSFRNSAGVDLDLIFASRVTAKAANVNYRNTDSVDISNRYEKANAKPPTSATGFRGPDGRDLSLWFTTDATGGLAINMTANDVSYNNGLSTSPLTRTMQAGASVSATGGTGNYTYTWQIESSSGVTGATLSATTGNNITTTATVRVNIPGTVTLRCTVSDGVSTASTTGTSEFNYYNEV